MSPVRILLVISLALACGCESAGDPDPPDPPEPECTSQADCEDGFECVGAACQEIPGENPRCQDEDGDGFGVADTLEDRATCEECEDFGRCAVDCDDNDPDVYPGSGCPEG